MSILLASTVPCSAAPSIVIDGDFQDWQQDGEATHSTLNTQCKGRTLWIDMQLPDAPVSLQNLESPWTLLIDLDAHDSVDLEYTFSPSSGDGRGIGATRITPNGTRTTISAYENQLHIAPTIAARRFELAIELDRPGNGTVTLKRGASTPVDSSAFSCGFDPSTTESGITSTPWPSDAAPGEIRIVSWNVKFGGLLSQSEKAVKILQALQPDVLLLQELEDKHTERDVTSLLDTTLGPRWNVSASPVGSHLRSMVAVRGGVHLPLAPEAIHRVDEPERFVRAALLGLPVGRDGQKGTLLLASVHLRCCGGPGSDEDMDRISEAMALAGTIDSIVYQEQARARQLQQLTSEREYPISRRGNFIAGIVIGGDLNLVGSATPLSVMTMNRDPLKQGEDVQDLNVVEALQSGGRTNATWSDSNSSFTPGRLDYILYSSSTLKIIRAFVLNTAEIDPDTLRMHGLEPQDTATVSDHFPLVVDLTIP